LKQKIVKGGLACQTGVSMMLQRKWWICGLLLLATTINYMDRVTLANAATRITTEFSLSEQQYGNLELGFGWAFAAGSLIFGLLADRVSVWWLYPVVLLGWSGAGWASGHTTSVESLLICRVLLGIFEAGHWPCALKTTFALLNPAERTMGNSVLQSGASVGAILTPPLMLWLMTDEISTWRYAFQVVGAVGLVWIVAWFALVRKSDLEVSAPSVVSPKSTPVWPILLSARFWAVAMVIFGAQTCWHLFRVWLPKFLQQGRGYSETMALGFNSVYYMATDVGCILAGVLSLWLVKRGLTAHVSKRRVYLICCLFTSMAVLIPWLPQGWALLGVILLVGMGALGLFPCYYSFVQELSDQHVGKLTGILSMWVWAVTSPVHPLFGKLVDETKSYDWGMAAAGLVPWLGVLALSLLWRTNKASV
jgi:MFS transporter, ACS family, hexuronate transporter